MKKLLSVLLITGLLLFNLSFAAVSAEDEIVWEQCDLGIEHTGIKTIAIDPQTPSTLYVGTGTKGAFKSSNGGVSWREINNGLTYWEIMSFAINPQTPSTLYAGTFGVGVFKSIDGGEN